MKLRFRTKLSYGIGGVADNALYTLEATYLLFFLTQIAGIKPAVAGAIMAFGSIFESICGPIVGYTSDNIKTKYGKRKPFMIIASIPTAVVSTLLFSYLDAGPVSKILYYTVLVLLYWGLFAIFFVPYIAWGSDLTEDYNERTSLRSFAYIGNQTGMAIGMVLPAFVTASLQDSGMSGAAAWRIIGISTGAISAFVLLFSSLTIHETDNPGCREKNDFKALFTKAKLIAMFREYINIFKLRPAKYLILSSFICLIGSTFFKSSLIYRLSYDLGLSGGISSIAFLAITIAGIVFSPLLAKLSCFTDKTFVFKIGLATSGALMFAFHFVNVDSFRPACVLCICYALGNACYWQLMPSMIYDVCEAEELVSGAKHSGSVISMQALSESISCAVGIQLLGIVLESSGFQEGQAVQPAGALLSIDVCTTIIPGLIFIAVAFLMKLHPINKKNYARIIDALERRSAGDEINMSAFTDIYGKDMKSGK